MSRRPDYCPIGNEPCQSLCETPCGTKAHKPLTPKQIKAAIDADPSALQQGTLTAFCRGVRFAERSHGITATGTAPSGGEGA